jgi:hypothetical protein
MPWGEEKDKRETSELKECLKEFFGQMGDRSASG